MSQQKKSRVGEAGGMFTHTHHPHPLVPLQQITGNQPFFFFFFALAAVHIKNMQPELGLRRKVVLDLYSWYVVKHVFMLSKIK